ncbi:hypothetical protein DFH27DRAFT_483731 [Peziza echinospora]|nr:hypothetical protein DFH27DRAFT_483731 [Peziza echinospora]
MSSGKRKGKASTPDPETDINHDSISPPPHPQPSTKRRKTTTTTTTTTKTSSPLPPPPPTLPSWPAPQETLASARTFLLTAAQSPKPTLILPDRDVDGLCAGTIISTVLQLLGKPAGDVIVHFIPRRRSLWDGETQAEIQGIVEGRGVGEVVVCDQGTRGDRILGFLDPENNGIPLLLIDHHQPTTGFPPDATIPLSSAGHEPVVPASLLAYILCYDLHTVDERIPAKIEWLGMMGCVADLGMGVVNHRFAEGVREWVKGGVGRCGGSGKVGKVVGLLNSGRRAPEGEVKERYRQKLEMIKRLELSRDLGKQEMQRWRTGVRPLFTRDGRMAVLEIHSRWQIHPLIAVMWAQMLGKRPKNGGGGKQTLQAVACVNTGYIPGKVNFAVRIAGEREREKDGEEREEVDLIRLLGEYADRMGEHGREILGEDFARGHREATGGSLEVGVWREFREKGLEVEERSGRKGKKEKEEEVGQRNTLDGFLVKKGRGRPKKEVSVSEG